MDDLKQVVDRAIEQFADKNGYMDIATDDADLFTSAVLAAIHASGHRIVPVEPTGEQIKASHDAIMIRAATGGLETRDSLVTAAYRAMLTAYGQKGE